MSEFRCCVPCLLIAVVSLCLVIACIHGAMFLSIVCLFDLFIIIIIVVLVLVVVIF